MRSSAERRGPLRALGVALALGAVALLLLGCAPERRVVLLGDSLTVGQVSEPPGPPYAELLEEALRGRARIAIAACGGTTSADWTRSHGARQCRLEPKLPDLYEAMARPLLPADLVVVMLGTNDARSSRSSSRTPPEAYAANLREIVDSLRADGADRVVLVTPPLIVHRGGATMQILAYHQQIEALCAARDDVICGPDLLALLRAVDFGPADLHPNGAGHAKIAQALAAALEPLL